MNFRRFLAACAAVVLCAALAETVEAYPVTARSGITTVTGVYRPLDLDLSLSNGTNALSYCANCFSGGTASGFTFTATFGGSYSGYGTSGDAGTWELYFSYLGSTRLSDDGTTITLTADSLTNAVGTLTYLGGGDYASNPAVPYGDTPQNDDYFNLFATSLGSLLEVTCSNDVATCTTFEVRLMQELKHIGPYVYVGEGSFLDDGTGVVCDSNGNNCVPRPQSRLNPECVLGDGTLVPCGSVPEIVASSVPEPGSLALVGLALGMLAWGRRRVAARPA